MPSSSAQQPLSAPVPITADHDVAQFDCGKPPLTDWLRQHARKNDGKASRTFVVCEGQRVVAFYALAAGSMRIDDVSKKLARNMPPIIPVLVLGRMAVDKNDQGRKIGSYLLKDALKRALNISREVGARAVLVHAIDQDVVPFHADYGFKPFPEGELTLFLPIQDIAATLTP